LRHGFVDFYGGGFEVVAPVPVGVVGAELREVGDVPYMVAYAVGFRVGNVHALTGYLLAKGDGFFHRAVRETTAARIINLSLTGIAVKMPEHID